MTASEGEYICRCQRGVDSDCAASIAQRADDRSERSACRCQRGVGSVSAHALIWAACKRQLVALPSSPLLLEESARCMPSSCDDEASAEGGNPLMNARVPMPTRRRPRQCTPLICAAASASWTTPGARDGAARPRRVQRELSCRRQCTLLRRCIFSSDGDGAEVVDEALAGEDRTGQCAEGDDCGSCLLRGRAR